MDSLVIRSQQGDHAATLQLLERLGPFITTAVKRAHGLKPEEEEDLRQDAILAALQACATFHSSHGASFLTWAYRSIFHAVNRRSKGYQEWYGVYSLDGLVEEEEEFEFADCWTPTPEQELLIKEEAMPEEVEDFGEYFRAYCKWEDLDTIAERCGVQRSAVEAWYRGHRLPRHIDDLQDIAAVIQRPFEELLRWYRRRPGRENDPLPVGA